MRRNVHTAPGIPPNNRVSALPGSSEESQYQYRSRVEETAQLSVVPIYAGINIRSSRNPATPAKKTSAILIPGSRFTSGTRSVAAT